MDIQNPLMYNHFLLRKHWVGVHHLDRSLQPSDLSDFMVSQQTCDVTNFLIYEDHRKPCHGGQPAPDEVYFRCHVCPATFSMQRGLLHHTDKMHPDSPRIQPAVITAVSAHEKLIKDGEEYAGNEVIELEGDKGTCVIVVAQNHDHTSSSQSEYASVVEHEVETKLHRATFPTQPVEDSGSGGHVGGGEKKERGKHKMNSAVDSKGSKGWRHHVEWTTTRMDNSQPKL